MDAYRRTSLILSLKAWTVCRVCVTGVLLVSRERRLRMRRTQITDMAEAGSADLIDVLKLKSQKQT